MRVVIDGRMLNWTGIGRYTRHLVEELAALAPDDEFIVLVRPGEDGQWTPPAANVSGQPVDLAPYSLAEQRHLGAAVRALRPDVAHYPHFTAPVVGAGPSVVTIHDLTMRRFRNVAGTGLRERARYEAKFRALGALLPAVARRATVVLAPSEFVAGQLVDVLRVDRRRVVVTPEAPEPLTAPPEPVEALVAAGPFLLHVGNAYPHKNLGLLVEVLGRLPGTHLALAGPSDWFVERLEADVAAAGLAGRVTFCGRVSDGQLAWLYDHAALFVLPSRSEGFGLVGLEAMARGLPVLAARASCLPEVYGDAAVYADPDDAAQWAATAGQLLADDQRRAALAEAGRIRAAGYSWTATATLTLAAYRRAAG